MGLAGVELIMSLEDRFNISIADEDAMQVNTVSDMQQLISRKLHSSKSTTQQTDLIFSQTSEEDDEWTDERIWQTLLQTIAEECNFPRQSITPDKHLWRDICQD